MLGLVGSWLCGGAKELFLYLGTANTVLVMAQGFVMVCDTHGTALAWPRSLTPVWGAVLGSTVIISQMNQSHGDSRNFVHQPAELSTWAMPWLLVWFSSGVTLVAEVSTQKSPQNIKRMICHETRSCRFSHLQAVHGDGWRLWHEPSQINYLHRACSV